MERVLITGMGGELGTRVAQLIEQRSWAGEVVGVDFVPPRRRLRRAVFHRAGACVVPNSTASTRVIAIGSPSSSRASPRPWSRTSVSTNPRLA